MTVQKVSAGITPAPDVFDFRRTSALPSETLRAIETGFGTFARQWATQLTTSIRSVARVRFAGFTIQPTATYLAALPEHTALIECRVTSSESDAIVQVPTSAALGWFALALGGTRGVVADDRDFTSVELAFVRRLVDDLLLDLGYALGALMPDVPTWSSVSYAPHSAHPSDPAEQLAVASFSVQVNDRTAAITIAVPVDSLATSEQSDDEDVANGSITEHLASVPVEVALRLDSIPVTPDLVLALSEGDLIPLGHPHLKPLTVSVSDRAVATAAVATSGRQLAFIVTDRSTIASEESE